MKKKVITFQEIIQKLQNYWEKQGCSLLQPYDIEVGAGTLNPMTALYAITEEEWNICYVQPSRRPADGRMGQNPNRLQKYYQFQVILKPSPDNMQNLYLESLVAIGVDLKDFDIRFIEDDWENPSIGASGLGWEVWMNNMEVSQYTYMQQIGGIELDIIPGEITYGLERLAMYIQGVDQVYDLIWDKKGNNYFKFCHRYEEECSQYNAHIANVDMLFKQFNMLEEEALLLLDKKLPFVAYDLCLKCSHILNILAARGVMSVTERALYISRVRNIAKQSCVLYKNSFERNK